MQACIGHGIDQLDTRRQRESPDLLVRPATDLSFADDQELRVDPFRDLLEGPEKGLVILDRICAADVHKNVRRTQRLRRKRKA